MEEGKATAHIALDIRVTQGGYPGIGRAVVGLAMHLLAMKSDHRFALIYQVGRPLPATLLTAMRAPHHLLPINTSLRTMRDQVALPFRLRQDRIDLYHAPYYGMALRPGVPYVVAVHDIIPVLFPYYWLRPKSALIRIWQRQAVRGAARVITGSAAAAADVCRVYGLDRGRVAVTPWSVVRWPAQAIRPADFPARPYLLCVCTNKPHKNLPRLIGAYASARDGDGFPDLVIAGGWSDRYPEAAAAAQRVNGGPKQGPVHVMRNLADASLRYVYEQALGFIFPSLYEGFGLPVLEAMQAGLPVAASTTPAVAEVCGAAALLFDPLDQASIAMAVRRLALEPNLRRRLRLAGAERLKAFTWEATAAGTLAIYEAAL